MGRTQASRGAPPPSQLKDARAKKAKQTINKDIPQLLKAYPRAQAGMNASEIFIDVISKSNTLEVPTALPSAKDGQPSISIKCVDTLHAAQTLAAADSSKHSKKSRLTILNMASPLRPGGGFLNGATSQEESLCMRTTLLPSLKEEFYRLPEVGGVFTPDVLVFRSHEPDAPDLDKNARYFINVITAAMHRLPDTEVDAEGVQRYTNGHDRIAAEAKIRAVLQLAKAKNTKKLVLGAWGCGAYGNPVFEIATIFRKVLLDSSTAAGGESASVSDDWSGIEIVFAIRDRILAHQFSSIMEIEVASEEDEDGHTPIPENGTQDELSARIEQLEAQINFARSPMLRQRLSDTLEKLRQEKDFANTQSEGVQEV